jgi:transketolase C-terminal domain/subunit
MARTDVVVLEDIWLQNPHRGVAKKFPEAGLHVGIAEQNLMGHGGRLAVSGKTVLASPSRCSPPDGAGNRLRQSIADPNFTSRSSRPAGTPRPGDGAVASGPCGHRVMSSLNKM